MIRFRFWKKIGWRAKLCCASERYNRTRGGSSTSPAGKSAAACRNGLTPTALNNAQELKVARRLRRRGAAQDAIRRSNGAWRGTAKAARPNDRTPLRIAAHRSGAGARLQRWHLRLCNSLAGFQRGKSLGQGWYAHVERVASEARLSCCLDVWTFGSCEDRLAPQRPSAARHDHASLLLLKQTEP
jgi:hypothetical protein